jgi:hypothetical protein
MSNPRFLIGQGEKLSEEIARPPRGMGDKAHPYSFAVARRRLALQWENTAAGIEALPDLALPCGKAALEVTLHPSYLAKSYYPANLIRELGLWHLGSRAAHVVPNKVVAARAEESGKAQPAPVLFLAGSADALIEFGKHAGSWSPSNERVEDDFRRIGSVAMPGKSRLKRLTDRFAKRADIPLEVVLHNPDHVANSDVVGAFAEFMRSLDIWCDLDRRQQVGGLAFLPIIAPRDQLDDVLNFAFLRVLREVPRIVPFDPVTRSIGSTFPIALSSESAVAPDLSVAIFDGGLPDGHGLEQWVTLHDAPGVGAPSNAGQRHGLAVTSAFLFGPLKAGESAPQPYANVDHWRVFGESDGDFEAFDLLDRIEGVLTSRRYDFINISLGPAYAIDDDDVRAVRNGQPRHAIQ